ncbi:RagB/SusD family nutrient uptake outer membrane protein [Chitinophaga sp. NPDC101104]|uniref:RagB/SusD family nutrient uptake outer membrane protein n=1 Tax=Chitinophaga sp. NPDC101104 TaxID=3390561 RepID=UPI003D0759DF
MMKRNSQYIWMGLACVALGFASCKKSLEDGPLELLTEDYIFDKTDPLGQRANSYLSDLYSYLPNGYNRIGGDVLDAGSDDAMSSEMNATIEYFKTGRLTNNNNPDDTWARQYAVIRKANIFLANIDVVPVADSLNRYWKAETRFLRAMSYFELYKRYGGAVLLGDRVLQTTDNFNIPRNAAEEVADYITKECDAIKDLVRPQLYYDVDLGRITKAAVLALKARTLLYAASPSMNPSASAAQWQAAASAAEEVLAIPQHRLEAKFSDVFLTRNSPEIILAYQQAANSNVERQNEPIGYQRGGRGITSPTQELVDAFPMKNGLPISDPASNYSASDPYKDRDPRFYLTVFHNGMSWLGRPIETFEGGRDKPGNGIAATRTGYYMRKFMTSSGSASSYSNANHNFPIFRYGQVMLDCAEATNEAQGPVARVFALLRDIRRRGGIEAGADGKYGVPDVADKAAMRIFIRNERRIEMAFEEQRFWDIRRWKIAENVLNGSLHGMKITKAADGALTYERTAIQTVSFDARRMYRYPVPLSEVQKTPALGQNPNW